MQALVCDLCGGKLVMGTGGTATCDSCGMSYSMERMKEKIQEIQGIVRIDHSPMIDNYLQMAQTALEADNKGEAETYANKIIEIDPENYQAWLIKGKSAGWQSTLQNPRFSEIVTGFAKALQYAPEEEKDALAQDAKDEIKSMSQALISLRAERFIKWPDKEETEGFLSDIAEILKTMAGFLTQTGLVIPLSEMMAPLATQINQAVVQAWQKTILPAYQEERYPGESEWQTFIERIQYCTTLVDKAIDLCDEDDEEDISRYENLIFLHKQAMKSAAWDYEYLDFGTDKCQIAANERNVRSHGFVPDADHSRYWHKTYQLSDEAIRIRTLQVTVYETKIKRLKEKKMQQEKEEKEKKMQQEKEEKQRRFQAYWEAHADEHEQLTAKKEQLEQQLHSLKQEENQQIGVLQSQIPSLSEHPDMQAYDRQIRNARETMGRLGVFKKREKKELQERIDSLTQARAHTRNQLQEKISALESQMASIHNQFAQKCEPLQSELLQIKKELTRER